MQSLFILLLIVVDLPVN